MSSKNLWRRIADNRVRHVWKLACPCAVTGGAMAGGEVAVVPQTAEVGPDFYAESGTPICQECGANMAYSHALVRR